MSRLANIFSSGGCSFVIIALVTARIAPCKEPATPQPGLVAEAPAAGRAVAVDGGFMVPYVETIPGTDVAFEMVPVPGGEFLLGSPEGEADRVEDEGPQVRVVVEPFWMGKCEVTWAEYHAYMDMYEAFKQLQQLAVTADPTMARSRAWDLVQAHARDGRNADPNDLDAVTCPTPLYDPEQTESAGAEPDQPAVTMTQFAARQYTKWLSGLTERNYRLPSEVEWEYAARAGTTGAYSFGDDPAELDRYAWFDENADYQLHAVGSKEPNAWGLHDMHGNAAEWTLDEYEADRYAKLASGPVAAADAIAWPTRVYPLVIRGGGWLDAAAGLRSAARFKSEEAEWKLSDPNSPHSPWWYTEEPALAVGMRIVRPLAPMADEEKDRAWEADVERLRRDLSTRLQEGRAALGVSDPTLPDAVEAAESLGDES
jgi:formylglycine-generating enzyme required for sulfatase activity